MRYGFALALVAALSALGAGLASSAPTGDGTSKDPAGDVHAKGLSKAQAAAMDVVSVRVTGAKGVGVFVTATFRGNIQKEIGRGALANAAAALVLRPKTKGFDVLGVVSSGPGKIGTVRRHTKSTKVGAFRHGKKLTLFVLGPGYEKIKSVSVETVANAGLGKRAFGALDDAPYIGQRLWDKFITLHPLDLHVQTADPSGLTCPELLRLLDSIDADLGDPYFSQNVSAAVTKGLHAFRATVKALVDKCSANGQPRAFMQWAGFSVNEVTGVGQFSGPAKRYVSIHVVLPSGMTITNHLCPTQLPNAVISGNRIDCGGGILNTGEKFKLNVQTSPNPPNGMGGSLFGTAGGDTFGPFQITGP